MQRRENYKRSPSKLKTVGNLRFKPVTVLDLRGCGSVTDDNVETITTVFKQLTVLRIGNNPTISDKSMKSIALNSKLLEILDIRPKNLPARKLSYIILPDPGQIG